MISINSHRQETLLSGRKILKSINPAWSDPAEPPQRDGQSQQPRDEKRQACGLRDRARQDVRRLAEELIAGPCEADVVRRGPAVAQGRGEIRGCAHLTEEIERLGDRQGLQKNLDGDGGVDRHGPGQQPCFADRKSSAAGGEKVVMNGVARKTTVSGPHAAQHGQ